jgi:putative N6-adenine-specific DNA methylase
MDSIILIAIFTFGLETVVKRELIKLGFNIKKVSPGKIEFDATLNDIPKANLWLRSADRVLLKMGEFKAVTFDELFEQTKALPWEDWITQDGEFTVTGKAHKSILGSYSACQSIVKKSVVERLKTAYSADWFDETGPKYTIQVAMLNDMATLTIDTSGSGLNRRGYRQLTGEAALKETLAAALVQLTVWDKSRLLVDPMCGSGTILIEAGLIGRNIAPGLNRDFASKHWPLIGNTPWETAIEEANDVILPKGNLEILGYDIDESAFYNSSLNIKNAGLEKDIIVQTKDIKDLWIDRQYGILISNFPYGIKLGNYKEMNKIYISFHNTFKKKMGWSIYILTADEMFPKYFKRSWPDKTRKLFNGPIETRFYQYFGERPPRE